MSDKSENTNMDKEKGDSKFVSNKADEEQDRYKYKKKNEKKSHYERKEGASASNNASRKPYHPPPKRNIAQNRLVKLRAKLDAEIKLKDRVESVGISRLLDNSVVKVEKSTALPNKQKLPKIPKVASHDNSSEGRNLAAERLKKVKREVQATTESIRNSPSTQDRDSFMEIDEDVIEADKFSNEIGTLQNDKEIYFSNKEKNNVSRSNDFAFESNSSQNTEEVSIDRNVNATNNNDSPSDIIPFINEEISKIRGEPSYMASHTNFISDTGMEVDTPGGDLLILIDTNVFLSHLNIINYLLKNSSIPSLNSCVLVVPWPVIQEIDYAMKKNNDRLSSQARYANDFINDCLKKKHSRFFGQSLVDFKENFKNAVNIDDFILQYCMKFVSVNKKVVLLTNDKNLATKAMINNISVFTTNEFVTEFNLTEFF